MLMIRRLRDRFSSNMGLSILVRRHHHIEIDIQRDEFTSMPCSQRSYIVVKQQSRSSHVREKVIQPHTFISIQLIIRALTLMVYIC